MTDKIKTTEKPEPIRKEGKKNTNIITALHNIDLTRIFVTYPPYNFI
jgi:hypothetical protein